MCHFLLWKHPGCGHHSRRDMVVCDEGKAGECDVLLRDVIEEAPNTHLVCVDCCEALWRSAASLLAKIGSDRLPF